MNFTGHKVDRLSNLEVFTLECVEFLEVFIFLKSLDLKSLDVERPNLKVNKK